MCESKVNWVLKAPFCGLMIKLRADPIAVETVSQCKRTDLPSRVRSGRSCSVIRRKISRLWLEMTVARQSRQGEDGKAGLNLTQRGNGRKQNWDYLPQSMSCARSKERPRLQRKTN